MAARHRGCPQLVVLKLLLKGMEQLQSHSVYVLNKIYSFLDLMC